MEKMISKIKCSTPRINDDKGKTVRGSIAKLEKIVINKSKQTILIRSWNKNNPILLFLHGGPGCSEMGLMRHFNSELEKHFIVVNWDQRGTCKSFNAGKNAKDKMNIKQFVEDTYVLVKKLKKRFNKNKVYLMGHSWGTIIGVLFAKKYPKELHAYIGVSQVVNMMEVEKIADKFIKKQAKKTKTLEALKEIKSVELLMPHIGEDYLKRVSVKRKWIQYFGGSFHGEKNLDHLMQIMIKCPEYNLMDIANYLRGSNLSTLKLWRDIIRIDFTKQVKELKVPVFLLQGKQDYQTPLKLVKKYFNLLDAPKKKLVLFNKSAHNPLYEESHKFNEVLRNIPNKSFQ